jgi:hypothetical protein
MSQMEAKQRPDAIKTQRGKVARVQKAVPKRTTDSRRPQVEKSPAWWVFTREQATFVANARVLSSRLTELFGDEVSISHFERMLIERQSLTPAQCGLILMDKDLLALYEMYRASKTARDAQRDSFRVTKDIVTIEAALACAKGTVATGKPVNAAAATATSVAPK